MKIWACLNWPGLDYATFSLIQKPKRFGLDSSTRLLPGCPIFLVFLLPPFASSCGFR